MQRIDGATGAVSWEYVADDGDLSEVAVHPDGTVFVTDWEYHSADTYLVALDGLSGAATRWRLPWRHYQPFASGPIVRDDRTVQVLFNPHDGDWTHLQLATVLATNAPPVITDLYLARRPSAEFDPKMYRLIPQASGGLFVGQRRGGTNILRIGPGGEASEIVPLIADPLVSAGVGEVDYAVTDTVGRALIKRYTGETPRPYEVYDISFDPTTLSPGEIPFPSTDPYVSFRFISTDGAVYASGQEGGMFGANDNQVAPGFWAGLGGTASRWVGPEADIDSSSSYLTGSAQSTNSATAPSIHYFLLVPKLLDENGVEVTAEQYAQEVKEQYVLAGRGANPTFFIGDKATVATFRTDALKGTPFLPDIVAFVGHAALNEAPETCSTSPTCQATGLYFSDKALLKAPYCAVGDRDLLGHCRPLPWQFTDSVAEGDTVPVRAKVLFVASCALGEIFRSLWSIDESTDQALIVPAPAFKMAYLNYAALALQQISIQLAKHKTVGEAVDYANTYTLGNVQNLLQFTVLGGRNVRFK